MIKDVGILYMKAFALSENYSLDEWEIFYQGSIYISLKWFPLYKWLYSYVVLIRWRTTTGYNFGFMFFNFL